MDNGSVDAGQLATLSLLNGRGYGYGGIGVGGTTGVATSSYGTYGAGSNLYVSDKIDSSNDRQTLENLRIQGAENTSEIKCQTAGNTVALASANSNRIVDNLTDRFCRLNDQNEARFNLLEAESRKTQDILYDNEKTRLRDKNNELLINNQTLKFELSQQIQTCKIQCEPSCSDRILDQTLAGINQTLAHIAHKIG